uniref:carcinoembryonic antigen-related cell adhesion molecule 5-like isoform X2 n=1 Tax=Myxine glutinosa TaxID=7769 RepID=UPI00358F2E14
MKMVSTLSIIVFLVLGTAIDRSEAAPKVRIEEEPPSAVSLICEDIPRSSYVVWKKDDTPLDEKTHFHNMTSPRLYISPVSQEDEGSYTCEGDGDLSGPVPLELYPSKPHIKPSTYGMQMGSNLSLECSNVSPKTARVTWKRDGRIVANNSTSFSRLSGSYSDITGFRLSEDGHTLILDNLSRSDNGLYTCMVNTAYGSSPSEDFSVDTSYGPLDVTVCVRISTGEEHCSTSNKPSKPVPILSTTSFTLNCTFDSKPHKDHTWKIPDGKVKKSQIDVNLPRKADSGPYTCEVWNEVTGKGANVSISIIIWASKPHIKPSTYGMQMGSNLSLECSNVSPKTARVTWKRDGRIVANNSTSFSRLSGSYSDITGFRLSEDGHTLILDNLSRSDNGIYTCMVNTAYGSSSSEDFSVDTTYGPLDVTVCVRISTGEEHCSTSNKPSKPVPILSITSFTLNCTFDSKPHKDHTWKIPDGKVKKSQIDVNLPRKADSGPYTCEVWNEVTGKGANVSISIIIWAVPKVRIEEEPPSAVTLICEDIPESLSYVEWKKDDTPLDEKTHYHNMTSPRLYISPVSQEDEGSYTCEGDGDLSGPVPLELYPSKPHIKPSTYGMQMGSNLSLECSNVSPKTARVTWKRDGRIVANNSTSFSRLSGSYSDITGFRLSEDGHTLILDNLSRSDNGLYTCMVNTAYGSSSSEDFSVDTTYGPLDVTVCVYISTGGERCSTSNKPSKPVLISSSSSFTLNCTFDSKPHKDHTWKIPDGKVKKSQIEVKLPRKADSGPYTCIVWNEVTEKGANVSISIIILDPLPQPIIVISPSSPVGGSEMNLLCKVPRPHNTSAESEGPERKLTYSWKLNENSIERAISSAYSIQKVDSEHEGRYVCVVSNKLEQRQSEEAELKLAGSKVWIAAIATIAILAATISAGTVAYLYKFKQKQGCYNVARTNSC